MCVISSANELEKRMKPANTAWLQDGVAPQAKVGGNFPESKRANIPDDVPKGFISSHSVSNYGWIFNRKSNEKGYVTPRK
jgi:hypothetical protein